MSIVTKESNPELYNALFQEDEAKEILEKIKSVSDFDDYVEFVGTEFKPLLDLITNLREELQDLREDNYAYHQLMKMQNKREYRSKFLKEFQQEYNTNTFPDYDEIYKRYDKLEKENERLNLELTGYREAILRDDKLLGLKSKIDIAVKYIKLGKTFENKEIETIVEKIQNDLLNILGGDDNE